MQLIILFLIFFCHSVVRNEEVFEEDDYKYLFSQPFQTDWYGANEYCRYRGMFLVDIPTYKEQERLISLANRIHPNVTSYWTSGSDMGREGHYVWMTSGHAIGFNYFYSGQPDNYYNTHLNETENCLILGFQNTFHWNDGPCHAKVNFICRDKTIDPFKIQLKQNP